MHKSLIKVLFEEVNPKTAKRAEFIVKVAADTPFRYATKVYLLFANFSQVNTRKLYWFNNIEWTPVLEIVEPFFMYILFRELNPISSEVPYFNSLSPELEFGLKLITIVFGWEALNL